MPTLPAYPAILTPADWNNKKGVVAKIVAVPTKIGDSLKELQEAYSGVEWKVVFDPPTTTLKPMDNRLYEIKNAVKNQYDIFRDAVKTAKGHAIKARDEWSKNKAIPKDSKTHLDNVVKTFDTFWTNVDNAQKAAYKILTESREALAKLTPSDAAAAAAPVAPAAKKAAAPGAAPAAPPKLKIKPGAQEAAVAAQAQEKKAAEAKAAAEKAAAAKAAPPRPTTPAPTAKPTATSAVKPPAAPPKPAPAANASS